MMAKIPSQQLEVMYSPGDVLYGLPVTDMTVDGYGVVRHQGRVLFVEGALLGSVLSVRVTGTKKKILHAAVESILTPSPHAVRPWCPHADVCGACLWQGFSLQAAAEWKQKRIRECLARIGKCPDIPVDPVTPSPAVDAFRNKMAFAFAPGEEGIPLLGLRCRQSRTIVQVSSCGLQPPIVMDLLAYVRKTAIQLGLQAWSRGEKKTSGTRGYLRFLVVHTPEFRPEGRQQILVECITGPAHEARSGKQEKMKTIVRNDEALLQLGRSVMNHFSLTGFIHTERRASSDLAQGERVVGTLGVGEYVEKFNHLQLTVPYHAFLQTNTAVASALYARIAEEAALDGSQILWDLYSGVGSIALYVAKNAKCVHGFEIQAEAVAAANRNKAALGLTHCHFHAETFTRERAASLPQPDVIIVDPPRAGLEQEVVNVLLEVPAQSLFYVSCDIGTQARDIARLLPAWSPVKSIPFDMFPYTPHVENVILLRRNSHARFNSLSFGPGMGRGKSAIAIRCETKRNEPLCRMNSMSF